MKNSILNPVLNSLHRKALVGAALLLCAVVGAQAAPRRVLVVGVTDGFRHSAIELGSQIITQMGKDTGLFTVEVVDVSPNSPEFKRADGKLDKTKLDAANRKALADKMSAEGLKQYDAIIFNSTTGEVPLPDVDAFLAWIKGGKGFLGIHAATDTFRGHQPLHAYTQMIGAEFKTHGAQVEVEIINQDPKHPACKHYPATFKVFDEIYLLNGFERSTVHGLLTLDKHPNNKTPGDYPIAWCKEYGKGKRISAARGAELLVAKTWTTKPGRVFYSSLGHREDVWDPDWKDGKGERKNPPEVAKAFQQHLLGGIKWALGLAKGDAKPQQAAK
jgi:type 1 glutamine amidotransferase